MRPAAGAATDPPLVILPAQPGARDLPWNLSSWPKHQDAPRWRTMPADAAVRREWATDAHAFGYGDPSGSDLWRLSKSALTHPATDGVVLGAAFADLDNGIGPAHKAWGDPAVASAVAGLVAGVFPEARFVYATRGGIRVVWVLAEPVPLRFATWWLRAWHGAMADRWMVEGAPYVPELVYDRSCAEWSRCFRLPFVRRDGVDQRPDLIERLGASVAWVPDTNPELDAGWVDGEETPRPAPVDPPAGWMAWVSPGSVVGKYLPVILDHAWDAPHVAEGGRNTELLRVVSSLVSQMAKRGHVDAVTVYSILAPCVGKAGPDAPTLDDLWRMVEGTITKHHDSHPDTRPGATTAPSEGLPPVVGYRDTFFVLDAAGDGYVGPVSGSDLYMALRDHQPGVPRARATTGRLMPPAEIADRSGVRAERVELYYPGVRQGAPWDMTTRTLRRDVFGPVDLEPREDPKVAEWLALLGVVPGSKAMQWLAGVADLRNPTAAWYLQGRKGCGKGMFARALAALWRRTPVSFFDAVTRFTEPLIESPIVFLDEHMDVDQGGTGRFRSLVAESHHRIEPKGRPVFVLHGCPRVVICANGPGALDLLSGSHGAADLDAIASRIFHTIIPDEAALFLERLGGKRGTADWITSPDGSPGRVPRHLATLIQQTPESDGRYLVEGVQGVYHQRLITSDALYSAVLLSIAGALTHAGSVPAVELDAERGVVWVNPAGLHTRFRTIVTEDIARPTLSKITKALAALAGVETPTQRGKPPVGFWPIPLHLVDLVARDVGLPTRQASHGGLAKAPPSGVDWFTPGSPAPNRETTT